MRFSLASPQLARGIAAEFETFGIACSRENFGKNIHYLKRKPPLLVDWRWRGIRLETTSSELWRL